MQECFSQARLAGIDVGKDAEIEPSAGPGLAVAPTAALRAFVR
jgi:hypothetical protein